jgi:hypothetical protein
MGGLARWGVYCSPRTVGGELEDEELEDGVGEHDPPEAARQPAEHYQHS